MRTARVIHTDSLLGGDRREAIQFYRTYAPLLIALIRRKVNNEKDCEEILQDTLFAFLEALRDFRGASQPQTYLYAICHHKITDFYRKKRISQLVFSRMPALERLISPLLTPEEELDSAHMKQKIQRTLHSLLPVYRQILTFKYLDDLTVADIARKLSTTIKSAEMKLFRARKAFVEAFISI